MANDLSFVNSTGSGCQIFRDRQGCYVVSHALRPGQRAIRPTLAGAYAACQGWEPRLQEETATGGG
jgi:phage baseplate assembly protein W